MMTFWHVVGVLTVKNPPKSWKSSKDGSQLQEFSVVAERRVGKQMDQRVEDVIDFTAFRAHVISDLAHMKVGDLVECRGSMQAQPYTDKTGVTRRFLRLSVESIDLLCHNYAAAAQQAAESGSTGGDAGLVPPKPDDLPF